MPQMPKESAPRHGRRIRQVCMTVRDACQSLRRAAKAAAAKKTATKTAAAKKTAARKTAAKKTTAKSTVKKAAEKEEN